MRAWPATFPTRPRMPGGSTMGGSTDEGLFTIWVEEAKKEADKWKSTQTWDTARNASNLVKEHGEGSRSFRARRGAPPYRARDRSSGGRRPAPCSTNTTSTSKRRREWLKAHSPHPPGQWATTGKGDPRRYRQAAAGGEGRQELGGREGQYHEGTGEDSTRHCCREISLPVKPLIP